MSRALISEISKARVLVSKISKARALISWSMRPGHKHLGQRSSQDPDALLRVCGLLKGSWGVMVYGLL